MRITLKFERFEVLTMVFWNGMPSRSVACGGDQSSCRLEPKLKIYTVRTACRWTLVTFATKAKTFLINWEAGYSS